MRRGGRSFRRRVWALAVAGGLALLPPGGRAGPVPEDRPEEPSEDLEAALDELEGLDQPPSAAELARLLDEEPPAVRSWQAEAILRWQRDEAGRAGREGRLEASGPAWEARLRQRGTVAGDDLVAGTAAVGGTRWRLRAGGWTWRQGLGLLAAGAGRSRGLAADGGLGPSRGGARGWTGWPDPAAASGAFASLRAGAWLLAGGWGRREGEAGPRGVAVVGRAGGAWRLAAVRDGPAAAFGACGRWRRGPWSGAWEAATAGTAPALGAHLRWSAGRRLTVEARAAGAGRGARPPTAGSDPLLGRGPGDGAALRFRWADGRGASVALLVAAARRDAADAAAPERRLVTDLAGRRPLAGGIVLEASLRTVARTEARWSEAWPWAAPARLPGRRTQSLVLAAARRTGGGLWVVRVRTLAVDHSATTGRRSLAGIEVRGGRLPAWRLAWRTAWGDPVDLADAVSPLPGVLVPRHWGAWRGGWFGRLDCPWGPARLTAAADLREGAAGERALELWAAASARW